MVGLPVIMFRIKHYQKNQYPMKPLFTLSKLMLALTVVLLVSLSANAQKIPFQGKLLENGEPVDGQKTLVFSIADPAWTETHTDVQITDGLYSVVLGSITNLPAGLFNGVESLSLNVSVDGTALTPVEVYAPIANTRIYSDINEGDDPLAFIIDQTISSDNTGISNGARIFVQGQGSGSGDPTGLRADAEAFNTLYNTGVWGRALGNGNNTPGSENYGVYGEGRNNQTNNYGTSGIAVGGLKSVGVYGTANGASEENWAGYFEGDTRVTGDLTVDGVLNATINMSGNNEFSTTYDPNDANAKPALMGYADGTPLGYNDGGTPNDPSDDLNVQAVAIRGTAESNGYNIGVEGIANHAAGNGEFQVGVYGRAGGDGEGIKYGLRGDLSGSNSGFTVAVRGLNGADGVENGVSYGAWFDSRGEGAAGMSNYGVRGTANKNAGKNIGVYGSAFNGDSNYAGVFDGDVQINANQMGLGKKDWEPNPERPYFALRSTSEETDTNNADCDDPNTPETEFCTFFPDMIWMEVTDDGQGNEMGAINLNSTDGKSFRIDANGIGNPNLNGSSISDEGILNGQYFGGLNVGNDPNGNDPSGASGAFEIRGTNTLNARLMGQFWENADRPVLDLYGSHTDGGTWYWPNAVLDVQGDATNDWGSLRLYKSAEGENNHQEMITLEAEGGSGYFAGDLTVDGNINGNINLSSEAYALSEKDWENGTQGYLNLHGDDDPNTTQDSRRVALEVNGEGLANTTGSLNLFGPIYDDPNCTDCPRSFVSMNVQRDAGGNDPNGWNGYLELNGTTSPNVFIGARSYDSHDIPQIQLYGSKPDGNGWFYEQANFSTNLEGTQEWGSLVLRGNDGDHNIKLGAKSWEDGSIGARRPYLNMQGSINDDNLVWMEVYDTGDGNEAGSINFTSTDGAGFGMNAYGLTGTAQNIESNNFTIYGNQEVPDGGGGSYLPALAAMGFNEGVTNGNAGWLALRNSDNGNEEVVTIYMDGDNGSASFGSVTVGDYMNLNSNLEGGGANTNNGGNISLGGQSETTGIRMYGEFIDGSSTSVSHLALDGAGGEYVYLWGHGSVDASVSVSAPDFYAANAVYANNVQLTSDVRYKSNIQDLSGSLSNVMKMRGVSYNWLDPKKSQRKQIGVIAQEVEEVYPEFVHTNEEGMKSVNYSQMVAVLIEAIKELNTKITTLETENASLKASLAEVDGLKSQMKNLETLVAKLVQNDAVTTTTQQQ